MEEIKVGDTVRSFDFARFNKETEGKEACFIQGEVLEIGRPEGHSCDCYKIKVAKKVFGGEIIEECDDIYYAPVNGTKIFGGGVCDGVVKVSVELRFFKAILVEIPANEVLEKVYPIGHEHMKLEDRIGKCPECDSNSWMMLADESVAVRDGGKQYCECLGCGETTHL